MPRGGVDVDVRLPEGLPPIQGDPHQLRQLFTNLLTNAFEAIERHGRRRDLTAHAAGGRKKSRTAGGEPHAAPMVQVDVTDNGPGVPPDVMDRIFSPFFTTKPQGSGLGLAIVRKIVDAHDGRIDVSGRPRGGTRSASRCRSAAAKTVRSRAGFAVGFDVRSLAIHRCADEDRTVWVGFW